jgi:RNA polymerase sigma-B factor
VFRRTAGWVAQLLCNDLPHVVARWQRSMSDSPESRRRDASLRSAKELDAEIQHSLDRWLKHRDPRARADLCLQHDWMATSLARRFRDRGEQLDDLTQVARIGLLKAIDRFDRSFGTPFGAYASVTMLGELRRHFRDATWHVHVPRRIKDLQTSLRAAIETVSHQVGRPPSAAEVAEHLGVSVEVVLEALVGANAYRTESLDAPVRNHGVSVLDRMLSSEPSAESRVGIADLLARLSNRDRQIVELRFFEGWSQAEIAAEVGISQVHVSRLLRTTLESLHVALRGDEQ